MEIHELKDFMNEKFTDLDKRLTVNFKSIDAKAIATDKCIEALDAKVSSHEHWLWFMRGMGAIVLMFLGWIGVKIRF
jgi:hypothetical protein